MNFKLWKPASVRPEKNGEYLVLWSLGDDLYYRLMSYGTFIDDGDDGHKTEKIGWWENDKDFGSLDLTRYVKYWMELPDAPDEGCIFCKHLGKNDYLINYNVTDPRIVFKAVDVNYCPVCGKKLKGD